MIEVIVVCIVILVLEIWKINDKLNKLIDKINSL